MIQVITLAKQRTQQNKPVQINVFISCNNLKYCKVGFDVLLESHCELADVLIEDLSSFLPLEAPIVIRYSQLGSSLVG